MNIVHIGLVIGRFQPLHIAHLNEVLLPALSASDTLIVFLGSSYRPRTPKDPWTDRERITMIKEGLEDFGYKFTTKGDFIIANEDKTIYFEPVRDSLYSDLQWQSSIQEKVREIASSESSKRNAETKISLYGVDRDESTFYLNIFPQWEKNTRVRDAKEDFVNGTLCRESIFSGTEVWENKVSVSTRTTIKKWLELESSIKLKKEYEFLENYKSAVASLPYPIIYQTVDNIILWKGHILLAKRRSFPGQGLWALPGGFLDAKKTILDSAIEVARDKTRLHLRKEWLINSKTFDHPKRSLRGRTITTAHFWKLPDSYTYDISAGRNTSKVRWFEFSEVVRMSEELYEDHLDIIIDMLSVAR